MSKGLVIGMKDTPNLVPVYNGNNGAYNHGTNGYRPQPQQQQQPQAALKSSSGSSRAPMTAEELAEKKRMVQERLKEKEKRVSRLSLAMGNARGSTRTQQHVDQMQDKLRKMQQMLKANEDLRANEEKAEEKRREEERRMQRLTSDLEKAVDPNSMTKSQKDRRTKNMMSLLREVGGKVTEEALETLEKKERLQDEREKQERREKMEATEKRLKEINDKIRTHARSRDEQNVVRLQRQLEVMEGRLKDIEGGNEADGLPDDEDEEREMREWENKMKLLRKEREDAMKRRRVEMENKVRELQEVVEEKQRARQQRQEARYREMVEQINTEDKEDDIAFPTLPARSAGGAKGGAAAPPMNSADFEAWMQRIVESRIAGLEAQVRKRAEVDDLAIKKREEELAQREKLMQEKEKVLSNISNFDELMARLARIETIESKVDKIGKGLEDVKRTGGGGGGGGHNGPVRNAEEIMKEIQETQMVIFDDKSTEKQIADANIQLEKLMQEYEQTPECRNAKEEKRQANEKLNKAALEKVKVAFKSLSPDQMKERLTHNPELRIILMEPQAILKWHQNDFKMFAIRGLTAEELRAIRGNLPTFRRDQQIQLGWVESVESKIDELEANASKPPPPKPASKPASGGAKKKWKAGPAAAASGGDIFAEILARKKGAEGGDSGGSSAPPPPSTPNVPIAKNAPPPPMMKGPPPPRPPLPPPGSPASAPSNAPPPPPMMKGPPPPPPPSAPVVSSPPAPPPQAAPPSKDSIMGSARASRMLQGPMAHMPHEDEVKAEVDALVNIVFSGGSETEVVTKCKVLSEQIKMLAGEHRELAPKTRFLIMAVKEAMVSRNGTPSESAHAKQKLVVVVNSFKRALSEQ